MKTAVEIIREHFYTYAEPYNGFSEEPKWTISEEDFEKLIQQAKEIEKEYIVKAWWESPTIGKYCSAEQYYNETFKKQE